MRKAIIVPALTAVFALGVAFAQPAVAAGGIAVYDAIPSPLPTNLPSIGVEAYSMDEIGDHIALAGGAGRLSSATVYMSSWACESGAWNLGTCASTPGSTFPHPLTLNLYAVDTSQALPAPGALITSVTKTFDVPYRPSADPTCAGGRWRDGSGTCFNGFGFTVEFDLGGVAVPAEIIYGVAYNSTHHGSAPIGGAGGGYDSLNVGLNDVSAPSTGTDVDPDVVFLDSTWGGLYSDGGAGGLDVFRADTGWTGYTVAVEFARSLTVNDCKKGGWVALGYRNQGQCIAAVQANPKAGK